MGDLKALNTILQSLAPYRVDENSIALTQTILGRGGFGVVLLGEMGPSIGNPKGSTLVAVKQLHATGTEEENKKLALALANELHVWAGLAHPNVVPLVGFSLDQRMNKAWCVSPYMKNGNIRNYLNKHKPDMIVRVRMWGEVARGVFYLHRRGLCHGDIKGANVLVDGDGQAKICDFGLTKLMESGTIGGTTSTGLKGTIRYMAPEFFHEDKPSRTKKSDVWAWSCLGMEIFWDKVPYASVHIESAIIIRIMHGELPLDVDAIVVDEDIRQLFKRCWVADPDVRVDMIGCANAVQSVLERMQLAIKLDEPTSDHVAIIPVVGGAGSSSETPENRMGVARIDSVPSKSPDEEMRGYAGQAEPKATSRSDSKMVAAFGEIAIEDEPSRNIDYDQLRLQGHLEQDGTLHNLASSALDEYDKKGKIADLDEAIDLFRQVLVLQPQGHPERHFTLHNLAVSLERKYDKEGRVADLGEAIDLYCQSLVLRPEDHPRRHATLHNLALSLGRRHRLNGNMADLGGAIDLQRQSLVLRPRAHPERHVALHHLALSLGRRYLIGENLVDLDEAIDLYRQSLELQPKRYPMRHAILHNLAVSLDRRYDRQGEVPNLDDAIDLYRQCLVLRPQGRPERFFTTHNLAGLFGRKYYRNGNVADLDKGIDLYRQALALRPQGHPDLKATLRGLGLLLGAKPEKVEDDDGDITVGSSKHQDLKGFLRPSRPEWLTVRGKSNSKWKLFR